MSIYADLLEFKRAILSRVERDISNLSPPAQKAAIADVNLVEAQMHGYQERLDLWYQRLWDLPSPLADWLIRRPVPHAT